MQLPPGYQPHPNDPRYMWNPQTQDVQPIPQQMAPIAPPVAAQGDPFADYQDTDVSEWLKQHESSVRQTMGFTQREKNHMFIDFPQLTAVGEEAALTVRLVDDFKDPKHKDRSVAVSRHRMMTVYMPFYKGDRQWQYLPCFNNIGGPQDCPICKSLEDCAAVPQPEIVKHLANFKPRTKLCWKCILLDDPTKHYVQVLDEQGTPVPDGAGNPAYKMVPGVIRLPKTLHEKILTIMQHNGNPSHPRTGYPLLLIKKKTGPEAINITYDAISRPAAPIDPQLYPMFSAENDIDLRKEVLLDRFWRREDMVAIGEALRQKAGLAGASAQVPGAIGDGWLPHTTPGWEYHSETRQVRPVQAPPATPPMAAPPAALPPVPQALPAAPVQPSLPGTGPMPPGFAPVHEPAPAAAAPPAAPPAPPAEVPPPPAGLPPVAAPGLTQAPLGVLPPAPPPPGMPAGVQPEAEAVAPPPPAQTPPGALPPPPGGMSADELEASFGAPPVVPSAVTPPAPPAATPPAAPPATPPVTGMSPDGNSTGTSVFSRPRMSVFSSIAVVISPGHTALTRMR